MCDSMITDFHLDTSRLLFLTASHKKKTGDFLQTELILVRYFGHLIRVWPTDDAVIQKKKVLIPFESKLRYI